VAEGLKLFIKGGADPVIGDEKLEELMHLLLCTYRFNRNSAEALKMSGGLEVLSLKEDDVTKMLTACTHIGSDNVDYQMEQYVYKRRPDGKNMLIARHQQLLVYNL
jgi:hypothetical protein